MTKNQLLLQFIIRHGLPLSTMSILENTITLRNVFNKSLYKKHNIYFQEIYMPSQFNLVKPMFIVH
jgi:hypothetical protein